MQQLQQLLRQGRTKGLRFLQGKLRLRPLTLEGSKERLDTGELRVGSAKSPFLQE
jgi:hypothetical protein